MSIGSPVSSPISEPVCAQSSDRVGDLCGTDIFGNYNLAPHIIVRETLTDGSGVYCEAHVVKHKDVGIVHDFVKYTANSSNLMAQHGISTTVAWIEYLNVDAVGRIDDATGSILSVAKFWPDSLRKIINLMGDESVGGIDMFPNFRQMHALENKDLIQMYGVMSCDICAKGIVVSLLIQLSSKIFLQNTGHRNL